MAINDVLTNKYLDGRRLSKFERILPRGVNIMVFQLETHFILYLAEEPISFGTVNPNTDKLIGYIEFVIDFEDNDTTVTYIYMKNAYKGRGISVYLFILMAEISNSLNVTKINLDDDSDQAWKMNNLYVKLGMRYINPQPEPEMEGSSSTIIKKWNRQYFIGKGFFN